VPEPIRVLLVDDSALTLAVLQRLLSAAPEIQIAGTARSGAAALQLIPRLNPTVVCTDLHMPGMDGLELTQEIMARYPRPILVVSSHVQREHTRTIFDVLQAGAVDVFPKPGGDRAEDFERLGPALARKVRIIAGVTVFTRRKPDTPPAAARPHLAGPLPTALRVVAIGASTGGPQALQAVLSALPENFPAPVLCVQHISHGFLKGLVDWLGRECRLPLHVARGGQRLEPGAVYFPPEANHLELDSRGRLALSLAPALRGHRPSATVTFRSVARCFGGDTVGVLLSGMGNDGAEGMLAIRQAGGVTIAQDEQSCVVFGMPKEAIACGGATHVLPLDQIGAALVTMAAARR